MNVLAALAVILVVASVFEKAEGVDYIVGDSTGWRVPSNATNFYSTWASGKNFSIGDLLVFNFTTGEHNLGVTTKDGYENCDVGNTTTLLLVSGPATIPLVNATEYYFICQFPNHCSGGQKLEIKVSASTSTNTSSPPPPPPPPPSSDAALSVAASTLLMAVLFIATCTILF